MATEPTNLAIIYVGSRVGRSTDAPLVFDPHAVERLIQEYVDALPAGDAAGCVSVTRTTFIYRGGREPGIAIGLINYPRFPHSQQEITGAALRLAEFLRAGLRQMRVSIVTPNETHMISNPSTDQQNTVPEQVLSTLYDIANTTAEESALGKMWSVLQEWKRTQAR